MIVADIETLKYPVGKFKNPAEFSDALIREWIQIIEQMPEKLRKETEQLVDAQLDTPYREGGWTVRQVVHHLADSHLNSFMRFKLSLTEDTPTIKPYKQDAWAELADVKAPANVSVDLLDALHRRWVILMRSMSETDWKKKFHHPESNKNFELRSIAALYAWHCNHHLAHITSLKERNGWK
jgi:hypothetical protein